MADELPGMWIFGGGQQPFVFDAVVRESHESEISITENPVEGGSPAHDHAVILPKRLEIEGCVSDATLSEPSSVFDSDSSRSVTAFEKMTNLQESREIFTVITGLKRYPNMMLKSFRAAQDAPTSDMFAFTASLQEVRIVHTEIVTFPERKRGKTKRQGDKKTEHGEKKAEPPKPQDLSSIIFKGLFGGQTPDSAKSPIEGLFAGFGGAP